MLDADEEVVFDLRPHARRLIGPAIAGPVVVGLASYGYFAVPSGVVRQPARIAIAIVAAFLVLRYVLRPWLQWLTTRYVLTTQRLVVREGVLRRHGRDVPVARIADVSMHRSIRDRLLGCGTIVVETAGRDGQVVLADIAHAEAVARELVHVVGVAPDLG